MGKHDVVVVSLEDWDSIWRRNQFVCAELSRRDPSRKILFVGLPRNVSNELRRGRLNVLWRAGSWKPAGFDNVVVTHPWKLLPDSIGIGRRINQWMFRRHVLHRASELGMRGPVLWINAQSAVHAAGRLQEAALVYDITDDWISLPQPEKLRDQIRDDDAELCRKADATIVCSQRLFEMKRGMAESLHLIPNGVDAEHYRQVLDGAGPLPAAAAGWAKPVYGYTGSVHPDRVDVELVREFAQRTRGTVVLLGPDMLPPEAKARLALPNVVIFGQVPYHELPQYMRAFDVCIVPHRMTAFTESLNPIKLWEYLAAGKPIVSTDVAGFRDYPQFVKLARTADEFTKAAEAVLIESAELPAARRAEARRHSWSSRVDEIEKVIDGAIERHAVKGQL